MSSARSPDLRLELATDWRVVSGLLLWIATTIAATWRADLPLIVLVIVTLTLLVLGLPIVASQLFGLRPCSAARLVWSADGHWHCVSVRGASEELALSAGSRAFPGGALLVFRRSRTLPWVLLLQHRGSSNEGLRRLCGRLRWGGDRPDSGGQRPKGGRGSPIPRAKQAGQPAAGRRLSAPGAAKDARRSRLALQSAAAKLI